MLPYFRFTEFILGAGAAVIILKGWDIRCRPALAILSLVAIAALVGLYACVIIKGVIRLETSDLWQSVCFAVMPSTNAEGRRAYCFARRSPSKYPRGRSSPGSN